MNIFILSYDPVDAAQALCDKHIIKMGLEACQMLCTVYHLNGIDAPYKKTHENHPCIKWLLKSNDNIGWLMAHAKAIFLEYRKRYNKYHKSEKVLDWCIENRHLLYLKIPKLGLTTFVQVLPKKYTRPDALLAYRLYYLFEKKDILIYTKSEKPCWLPAVTS